MKTVAQWIIIICLPLLLITSNLRWAVNSYCLYEYGFAKYEVATTTELSKAELKKFANCLIDYFNSKRDNAQMIVSKDGQEFELFTEREIVHLKDVKDLVQLDYFVQYVTLALVAAFSVGLAVWGRKGGLQKLIEGLLRGSIVTIGLVIIIVFWSLAAFDQLFLFFHLIGFPNDFWILDPSQHYLIKIFPQGFFYEAALLILGAVLVEAVTIGGVVFSIRRLYCLKSYKCYNS